MGFFNELRRRNVFRVGAAYLVGAWLLLQLTEVLTELLSLPDSIGPVVVALVVIGLPIALFVAWAFELTPDGIKPEAEVDREQSIAPQTGRRLNAAILAMMAIALVYFIWESRFADRGDPTMPSLEQASSVDPEALPTAEADPLSIAVLPFDNRSRLEDDEFFVSGIHDDLLTNLARIGALKVISRTSVNRYRGSQDSLPEIARELGVAHIMEGAVQRSGNTVRINVQLIDAATDEHLWAEIYDRELTAENLFVIQTEISEQIAGALEATLTQEEQLRISSKPTENLDAYNAYLRGRQLLPRRNAEDLKEARTQFEQAVLLDPNFARAWGSLALAAMLESNYGAIPFTQSGPIIQSATERALELDPNVADAWLLRAVQKENTGQYAEAEADFLKALEVEPNYALAHHWYANYLDDSSARLDEAFVHAFKAVELDPLSSIDQLELGDVYQKLGQFDEAEKHYQAVLDRDPTFSTAFQYMGLLMEETGRFDEMLYWARQSQELNPGNPRLLLDEAWARRAMADFDGMRAIRERITAIDPQNMFTNPFDAFLAVIEGRNSAAMEILEGVRKRMGGPPFILEIIAAIHLMEGELEQARSVLEQYEPRIWSPDTWDGPLKENPSQACTIGWLMMQTGDEALGKELLNQVIRYYEDELPNYVQHPERFDPSGCYLHVGEVDTAVTIVQAWIENGFFGRWWQWQNNPAHRQLMQDPRTQDAFLKLQEDLAEQRANVRLMEAEGRL